MVYYTDAEITIRDMIPSDAPAITRGEIAQGWDQTTAKYEMRLRQPGRGDLHRAGRRVSGRPGRLHPCVPALPGRPPGIPGSSGDRGFRRAGKVPRQRHRQPADGCRRNDRLGVIPAQSALASACTAGTEAPSGCISSAATFRTAAASGTGTGSYRRIATAAMTTSWFCTLPKRCGDRPPRPGFAFPGFAARRKARTTEQNDPQNKPWQWLLLRVVFCVIPGAGAFCGRPRQSSGVQRRATDLRTSARCRRARAS